VSDNQQNEIIELFKKHNNYIITSHTHLDGDALGSELALYHILRQFNKKVKIINQDKVPDIYKFLPGAEEIIYTEKHDKKNYPKVKSGTILIVLDSSSLDRIGNINININNVEYIVNIDHHPSNISFGNFNYIDTNASSVGEILYQLGKEMGCLIDEKIAVSIYTAIVTDTGSFRYTNTTIKTFSTALQLVKAGANPAEITDYIYNNNNLSGLKLLGKALSCLKIDSESKISWTFVTREMISESQSSDEETEGIVDKILSVKNVQVSVFFWETKDGNIKISLRSKGNINVDKFARIFGGGGHPNAAGCHLEGEINEVSEQVISRLKKEMCILN